VPHRAPPDRGHADAGDEARRLSVTYAGENGADDHILSAAPRALVDGRLCCPLGVALLAVGVDDPCPGAMDGADSLRDLADTAGLAEPDEDALADFMFDLWDEGLILPEDLPVVLGLEA
jgi:hypothetical protein